MGGVGECGVEVGGGGREQREWWETAQIREGLFVARSEYFCPMALVENGY